MKQELIKFIKTQYVEGTKNIDISTSYQLKIGPEGAVVISDLITWSIQLINLNMYFIQNEGIQSIISKGNNWPQLKTLWLERNNITCEGLKNIDKNNWINLNKITLNKNFIKQKGFYYLVSANWPNLRVLQLSHNEIGVEGAMHFRNSNWPHLKSLNLNYNLIGNEGMRQISSCKWPSLQTFQLSNNKLDAKAMFYLSQMELPNLKNLSLNRNQIGKENGQYSQIGCLYLSNIKVTGLQAFHIFGNQITINGLRQILYNGKLKQNCFLQVIRNLFTYAQIRQDVLKLKLFCNVFTS